MLAAGFAAGWIDAVVGGGGLLQLPALLLVPGLSPVQALATNKMGSVFGTAVSAATYTRRVWTEGSTSSQRSILVAPTMSAARRVLISTSPWSAKLAPAAAQAAWKALSLRSTHG